jgi:multiple sugar transport system ATP-binding protein
VAGFIGSPAMNFMPGRVDDNHLRTSIGDVPLTDGLRREIESRGGGVRDFIIGIRPEAFEDASLVPSDARGHGTTFRATIDVVESMGSDVFVHFSLDDRLTGGGALQASELEELARDSGRADTGARGDQIVARLDAATRIREGDQAELWADARKLHVFHAETGDNLTAAAPEAAR